MTKTLLEAKIGTREQRKKLATGIHWRGIDPDVHLGYRKGKRGGVWVVRWYAGAQKYGQRTFGTADDEFREGTLDFQAAIRGARQIVVAERRLARAKADGPLLTVRRAIQDYIAGRDARETSRKGRAVRSDASSRLMRYIIGRDAKGNRQQIPAAPLASVALHDLTEDDLARWRTALPDELKHATKKRLINDLKAALNAASTKHRSKLPNTFSTTIKHGLRALDEEVELEPIARENQILSDTQVASLIGAAREIDAEQGWDGDLFRLIVVLAATGARFSQVARLRVRDLQRDKARLIVPESRKGRRPKGGEIPVPVGADVLKALLPAATRRPADAPLLERWRNKQISGTIRWERTERGPWQSASELNRAWAAIRERANLPQAIPYSLRHSSIVRGIKQLPIRLVAALHDTSVTMIERHYGRWIADGLDELAASAVVPLVPGL